MRDFAKVLGIFLAAFGVSMVLFGVGTLIRRRVPDRFQDHLQRRKKETFEWRAFGWSRIALGSGATIVASAAFVDSRVVWKVMVALAAVLGLAGQALDKRSRVPYVPEVVDTTRDSWRLPPE